MPSPAYVQRCIESEAVVIKAVNVGHSKDLIKMSTYIYIYYIVYIIYNIYMF